MKRTIKGIRSDLGLSQEEMAKELGISICTYRSKENYKYDLTAKELMKLSEIAKVSPIDIKLMD